MKYLSASVLVWILLLLAACDPEAPGADPFVPVPTSLVLDYETMTLAEGATRQIAAALLPEGAEGVVVWGSSEPAVASVDETGAVTALHAGNTVITAACGELSATCAVTVVEASAFVPVTGVVLDRDTVTLGEGETTVLVPTVSPADASDKGVSWTSDNGAVAGS